MVYVLDANGIIRAKGGVGKAIDQVVDRLVSETRSLVRSRSSLAVTEPTAPATPAA